MHAVQATRRLEEQSHALGYKVTKSGCSLGGCDSTSSASGLCLWKLQLYTCTLPGMLCLSAALSFVPDLFDVIHQCAV